MDTKYLQVDQAKEVVRLGSGSGTFSVIAPDAEARALEVIKRLVGVAEARDADLVRLVATSAVREAQNKNSFVRKGRERRSGRRYSQARRRAAVRANAFQSIGKKCACL